jgi:hypothetical protein
VGSIAAAELAKAGVESPMPRSQTAPGAIQAYATTHTEPEVVRSKTDGGATLAPNPAEHSAPARAAGGAWNSPSTWNYPWKWTLSTPSSAPKVTGPAGKKVTLV